MSNLLDKLSKGMPGIEFTLVKEWSNERGVMGVVRERTDNDLFGKSDVYRFAVLLNDDRLFMEEYTHGEVQWLLHDAAILAIFANASEVKS
jgi:hypothetical protein